MKQKFSKKIVMIGAGIAGINAATKLIDNGYPGKLITIIDKGEDPYVRPKDELMHGFAGAGGFSDGKLTYHTSIGGHMSKYCGEDKAMELMDQVIKNFQRFHPNPSEMFLSNPTEEPDFIKPHFSLRLFPVWHIGTDYLQKINEAWYEFLLDNGVTFLWQADVQDIDFDKNEITYTQYSEDWEVLESDIVLEYDKLLFGAGKSGIGLSQQLIDKYELPTEPKSAQVGVRFEAPQKYFEDIIEVSYDFKLYQRPNEQVSLRSFCTNNFASYVAVEETYGDITYNGHAKKGEEFRNDMTNFGILMEVKDVKNPFEWTRKLVQSCQNYKGVKVDDELSKEVNLGGIYYSPNNTRQPSLTDEGKKVKTVQLNNLDIFKETFGEYAQYVITFIENMNEIFKFGNDWGIYIPEVKYLNEEVLVNYDNLSLVDYENVHFVGDTLSARGITISGAQSIYAVESILKELKK